MEGSAVLFAGQVGGRFYDIVGWIAQAQGPAPTTEWSLQTLAEMT